MVANSLVGVVAQRLMRKVCPYCKKEVATSFASNKFRSSSTSGKVDSSISSTKFKVSTSG